jgi:hypothetical protein
MTVSDQIIQVLDALCEKFGLMIDWTSENVIPYISTLMGKLIQWEIWSSVAWIAMAVVALISLIVLISRPSVQEAIGDGCFDGMFAITGLILFGVACIVGIITQTMDIIKCVTFPEMHIFEYIQRVINSGS